MRADDHDRSRRLRHDVADRGEPVELRHLKVHRDDVGLVLMHLADGVEPVPRGRDDLELAGPAQDVAEHAPHERAVVGHEDARSPLR